MQLEVGAILEGKVTGITNFGVFVELEENKTGMVHISEVAPTYVNEIREHVQENQTVKVKVLSVSDDGKISLSIKRAMENQQPRPRPAGPQGGGARPQNSGVRPQNSGGAARPQRDSRPAPRKSNEPLSFEDMMSKFKQSSDEKLSDIKRKSNDRGRGAKRAPK